MADTVFALLDVTRLDARQLTSKATEVGESLREVAPKADPTRHNELATIALLGTFSLLTLAAQYYFGKRQSEQITLSVEEIAADGSRRKVHLTLDRTSVEPVKEQILKQLAKAGGGG